MSTILEELLSDLVAESEDLDRLVADLDDEGWRLVTPAAPWSIADVIGHLHWTDDVSRLSATDPDAFATELQHIGALAAAEADGGADPMTVLAQRTAASFDGHDALLRAWREGRAALADALRAVPDGTRLPWMGTSMAPASMATARLMETWAHGHDVADTLGVSRRPTERLRHVARLAVRARPYTYAVHDLELPDESVEVVLTAPDGGTWRFGPDDAAESITGSAYDFCLVAVQRLHPDDTDLVAEGDTAREWLGIVQAFAGPPGGGRQPGEGHR